MPFWRAYYHIVWSTKNREDLITPEYEPMLFAYIMRKAAELDSYIYALNGWTEHMHIVAAIPPKISISHFVKEIKGSSSHYLNQHGHGFKFAWQRGYGMLTLGQTQLARAVAYVEAQKEHHRDSTAVPWLEHCTEFDEGPEDQGIIVKYVPALREQPVTYNAFGDPPF